MCTNTSTVGEEILTMTSAHKGILIAIYSVCIVFILTANIILNYILFTRRYMRTKYIFTASLGFAHILFSVFVLPCEIATLAQRDDVTIDIPYHVVTCYCVGLTSHNILTISIRRCMALSERFRNANFTYRGKVANVLMVWMFSLIVALPQLCGSSRNIFSFSAQRRLTTNVTDDVTQNVTVANRTNEIPYKILAAITVYVAVMNKTTSYITNGNNNWTGSDTEVTSSLTSHHFWIYDICLVFIQLLVPCSIAIVLQCITLKLIRQRPNQRHWVKEINITKQHLYTAILFLTCWTPLLAMNAVATVTSQQSNMERNRRPESVFVISEIVRALTVVSFISFPLICYKWNAHMHREFLLWCGEIRTIFARGNPQEDV